MVMNDPLEGMFKAKASQDPETGGIKISFNLSLDQTSTISSLAKLSYHGSLERQMIRVMEQKARQELYGDLTDEVHRIAEEIWKNLLLPDVDSVRMNIHQLLGELRLLMHDLGTPTEFDKLGVWE
jgi:hypothetical protein